MNIGRKDKHADREKKGNNYLNNEEIQKFIETVRNSWSGEEKKEFNRKWM